MAEQVAVELLRRVTHRGGGLLHRGEVAAFDKDVAQDLVRRGLARPGPGDGPLREEKAVEAPPADKMVGGAKGRETLRRK